MKNSPISKIAVFVAMKSEAMPMISSMNMEKSTIDGLAPELGLDIYSNEINGQEVYLVINGSDKRYNVDRVGCQAAAIMAFDVIHNLRPDTIINAGTAGGFAEKGAKIGDVFVATDHFIYHDRTIPLGDFESYGVGYYPCLEAPAMVSALELKSGVISTANKLSFSENDADFLQKHNVSAKEMEVAAIAEVCNMFGTRVMAVKAITNIVSLVAKPNEEFTNNFQIATTKLAETMPLIIEYMLGKTPSEL